MTDAARGRPPGFRGLSARCCTSGPEPQAPEGALLHGIEGTSA
jgi:hypothetical protein